MKFILVLCLVAVTLARPEKDATVLRSESEGPDGAEFSYSYETSNGISASKQGTAGSEGQSNHVGTFSFTFPDGTVAKFDFVADEEGYRVESPLLPVAPEMPPHALEQIKFAEEQRAQGVTFE